jgi:hypothetical protein
MLDSTMPQLRHNPCFDERGSTTGTAPDPVLTFARRPPPSEQLRREKPVAPRNC